MESAVYWAALVAALAVLLLLWLLSRKGREVSLLSLELQNSQTQSAQWLQKYETAAAAQTELAQLAAQQQAQLEAGALRIGERDEAIADLNARLALAQADENRLEDQIRELTERAGAAQARAAELAEQLVQQREAGADKEHQLNAVRIQHQQTAQELTRLRTELSEKQKNLEAQQSQFLDVRRQLNEEFQNLAQQVLEEKSRTFAQTNQSSLDLLLKPFKEQIEGFQKRINEVHSESLKGNAQLEAELKRVLNIGISMSQEAQNLTSALKGSNKIAGNWGEVQLETALQNAGLLKNEHYLAQESYRDGEGNRFIPDFVLRLPENKHLILDSKVSLLAYEQAVSAEDEAARAQAMAEHCKSLRNHIDSLSKKNYSALAGIKSPDFVLMFVPIEPAYIEAMKYDAQLFGYGYERNVILVSHTTLMPILRTVVNLWRIERGNTEAREIAEKAGEIYQQVCVVAERLHGLGATLGTVNNKFNQTVTALVGKQGLVGKVERFQNLSAKAGQSTPEVHPVSSDLDTVRLEMLLERQDRLPENVPHKTATSADGIQAAAERATGNPS